MKYNLTHVGVIMDGNGRWALKRGLPRILGHDAGVKKLIKILPYFYDCGVKCVSLFAFSTENKFRPHDEVDNLINLLTKYLGKLVNSLKDKNISFKVMGDLNFFPDELKNLILNLIQDTCSNTGGIVNIALNYGAQDEIIRAVNSAVKSGKEQNLESFTNLLYTADLPPLDLIIRTGGEKRLSNFMLFQAAYSEIFFSDVLWPDFSKRDVDKALMFFSQRQRRFGRI